jgi:hypothetical protein
LAIEGNKHGSEQKAVADWPWRRHPNGEGAEEQTRRPQPHVDARVVLLLSERLHHFVFDKGKHDVIQAARESTNKEAHRVLNGTGFKIETEGADDAGEHKVMEVVVTRAVEADQVINMNSWHHVSCVQIKAAADTLQTGAGGVGRVRRSFLSFLNVFQLRLPAEDS